MKTKGKLQLPKNVSRFRQDPPCFSRVYLRLWYWTYASYFLETIDFFFTLMLLTFNSYSSRTRQIWADICNQRGRNCFSKFSSNSLDFIGWNLLKSWHFLYWRRREKIFSDLQNFSTRNSTSVFPYLGHIMGLGNQSESWKIIILS